MRAEALISACTRTLTSFATCAQHNNNTRQTNTPTHLLVVPAVGVHGSAHHGEQDTPRLHQQVDQQALRQGAAAAVNGAQQQQELHQVVDIPVAGLRVHVLALPVQHCLAVSAQHPGLLAAPAAAGCAAAHLQGGRQKNQKAKRLGWQLGSGTAWAGQSVADRQENQKCTAHDPAQQTRTWIEVPSSWQATGTSRSTTNRQQ